MKKFVLAVSALLATAGAFALDAAAAKALASKSACLACHAADKKIVGPSYQDVAAKHKGQADALEKVAARIKSGGSGIYGTVPMPPQPALKDEELKLLAAWVLAGAPDK
ncbi:cytochrome C [Hydrogenophaga crassostreae]|uniref:Cytochrome C n=1 Tax=Hydrogenophaga crassostreae TaxID=1763535 RepID=A0ABX2UAZ5_9BURK|nr:c-type cytochrome [Hydrogenophaga crassostreae]OAD43778.1 cytochrome C [Hydrogenophaga crassostreae]